MAKPKPIPKPSPSPDLHRLVTEAQAKRELNDAKLSRLTGVPRQTLRGFLYKGRGISWEHAKSLISYLQLSLYVAAFGERMRRSKRIPQGES